MDNNFENVEVKESQAAELEMIEKEIDRLHEQKNENRGRNKKKAAEKKTEALADNDKKLPKAEDIDTAGMEKTKGVETPGETVQEDNGDLGFLADA